MVEIASQMCQDGPLKILDVSSRRPTEPSVWSGGRVQFVLKDPSAQIGATYQDSIITTPETETVNTLYVGDPRV